MVTVHLSREQFEAKRQQLSTMGVDIQGDSGTAVHSGVTVKYAFIPGTLTVHVTGRPFLISTEMAEERIKQWFTTTE
jgi:hypothetical protein